MFVKLRIKYNRILYGVTTLSAQQDFDPRDRKKYYLEETPVRRFLLYLVRSVFHTMMVMKVEGRENFPLDGPVIIAANHVTNFDVFPMQFAVPRAICYMGKAELFNTPLDPLLRVLCAFPVYRGEKLDMFMAGDSEVAKQVAAQLAEDAGFGTCWDFGKADKVQLLEQFALSWINLAIMQGHGRDIAFRLVRR